MKKESMFKIITLTILILVITTITSYAYFTASIKGNEKETSLSISGGTMNIAYNGGNIITLSGIYPREEAWTTKSFTVTGNNTTGADMPYNMSFVVNSNTFSNNSLKFSLTGTNAENNGTIASDIAMQYIPVGASEIFLGNGIFEGPATNKVHTYSLSIYFPSKDESQNEDHGKSFNAHINVEAGYKTLADIILLSNGGIDSINNKDEPDFDEVSPDPESLIKSQIIDEEVNTILDVEYGGLLYSQKPSFSAEYGGWEINLILDEEGSPYDPSTGELYTEGLEIIDGQYTFKTSDIGKYYLSTYSFVNVLKTDKEYTYFFRDVYKINEVENGVVTNATLSKPIPIFDGTGQGLYKTEDDYGDSYYFRGAKTYLNNNLIFAGHQWKITRINGDGSVRIIYNGECPGNQCEINTTGTGTHMLLPSTDSLYNSSGETAYNLTNYDDAKYVGYMYGGTNGEASTSREGATTNETSTNIKTYLDSWYEVNIKDKSYEKYIANTLFCNDRQLQSEVGGESIGTGFGKSETYYAAFYRLSINKTPSIKCNNQNDRFTTANYNNAIVLGNNVLNYPIGLLTVDEGALAGLKVGSSNLTNYLYTNQNFWTMSPYCFYGSHANVWIVHSDGFLYLNDDGNRVGGAMGVRGVLNLASNTPIIGAGTASEPYVVLD